MIETRELETRTLGETLPSVGRTAGGVEPRSGPEPSRFRHHDRYVPIGELGRGGMGVVERAYDPTLQREVALKVLRTDSMDEEHERRMVREARAMARLSHPNVVAVYDVELDSSMGVLMVMEYVPGGTLRQWLRDQERSWSSIVDAFVQAGRGLAAGHDKGILHRDFKPSNVLVASDGIFKVTDFGIAKFSFIPDARMLTRSGNLAPPSHGELTHGDAIMGTPRYMAPEQHQSRSLDARADQYAFCVALWEALAGAPPFEGSDLDQLLERKRRGPPAWPTGRDAPAAVARALARGLAVDPAQRWPSMKVLLEQLVRDHHRQRNISLALGAMLMAGGAVYGVGQLTREPPCADAEDQLAEVWGPSAAQQVRAAIEGTGASYAAQAWAGVDARLGAYGQAWVEQHTQTCEATKVHETQSSEVMALRMACLEQGRASLDAVVEQLRTVDAQTVEHVPSIVAGVSWLGRCEDVDSLWTEQHRPESGVSDDVAALRAELWRADAERRAGRAQASLRIMESVVSRAEPLEFEPLLSSVRLRLGESLQAMGRYADAEAEMERALHLGLRWRQWRVAFRAALELAMVVGALEGRWDEGLVYTEVARGLMGATLSTADRLELHARLCDLLVRRGQPIDAEQHAQTMLDLLAEHPDPWQEIDAHQAMADALGAQGRLSEAEIHLRASLGLGVELRGEEHPRVAMRRAALGTCLHGQRRLDEAEQQLRLARDVLEAQLPSADPRVVAVRRRHASVQGDQSLASRGG